MVPSCSCRPRASCGCEWSLKAASNELLDSGIARALKSGRRVHLQNDALMQHGDAGSNIENLRDFMADNHGSVVKVGLRVGNEAMDRPHQNRIEPRGRF